MREYGKIPPYQGGCWFCYNDDGEMLFSIEFDCFFHEECLKELIKPVDFYDVEAVLIAKEFGFEIGFKE